MLGGEPKERRYPPRLPSEQDVEESCPARSRRFSRRKIPPQRGQRRRRDRPLPKPLCATAALTQARRAKQLPSAYNEGSPSLDWRMDAA